MISSDLCGFNLTALQSELDASYKRALPLLQDGYISGMQVRDVKQILLACSLTYVASSLLSVMHIWPWLGRSGALALQLQQLEQGRSALVRENRIIRKRIDQSQACPHERRNRREPTGRSDKLIRKLGKPLIRIWLRLASG